ncbi:MAG: hypothetical protein ACPGUY_04485 [Akkermansiaceae bacterium]
MSRAIVFCLLVGVLPAIAQQDTRMIKARTLCYQRVANGAANAKDIFIESREDKKKIILPIENFSGQFACKLLNNEAIFFHEDGVDVKGKPKRKIVARSKVPASVKKAVFYFTPAKGKNKLLYNVRVMDDGLRKFPMGNTRLLNLHTEEVGFKLGGDAKIIKAKSLSQMGIPRGRDNFNMATVVCRMKNKKGQWQTISENRLRFTKAKRILIVSFVNSTTKQPELRIYRDLPARPDPLAPRGQ